jgi:hypothetical protein
VTADKSSARTYPTNTPDVGMLIEDLSDELVRRVFGEETKATLRALVTDRAVVLNDGDNVVVTDGPHVGEQFVIAGQLLNSAGASPHTELALAASTEALA